MTNLTNYTEKELIKGCKKNSRIHQRAFFEKFYSYVLSVSYLYAQNSFEAKDIVNDAFFKALSKIDQFKTGKPVKPWLRTITVRTAINHYRKRSKLGKVIELNSEITASAAIEADHNLSYNELVNLVTLLPDRYRLVFNLFIIEGFSHEEIAEKMEISIGTSKSNLHRARVKMKELLTTYYNTTNEHRKANK